MCVIEFVRTEVSHAILHIPLVILNEIIKMLIFIFLCLEIDDDLDTYFNIINLSSKKLPYLQRVSY